MGEAALNEAASEAGKELAKSRTPDVRGGIGRLFDIFDAAHYPPLASDRIIEQMGKISVRFVSNLASRV
jgi:hypothetical protein